MLPMRSSFRRYQSRVQFIREVIGDRTVTLLDVGNLGDGASTCAILKADVERCGGTYFGLDSNAALTKKLGLPNQILGDLHRTSLPEASFDILYAGEIIEHTWTPAVMIDECRRLLKPGGLLVLDTPNPYALQCLARFLFRSEDWMGDNRFLTYQEAKHAFSSLEAQGQVLLQPQHKIFFTPAMLYQLLETRGFVVVSIGCTLKPKNMLHRLMLWMFPQSGHHLCVVARKASIDEAFADVASSVVPS